MEDFDLSYFLALRLATLPRAASMARLLAAEPPRDLASVAAAAGAQVEPYLRTAACQCSALRALGVQVLPVWHLPARLRRASPVPLALFVRGDVRLLARPAVAVVGSRRASTTGKRWAMDLAQAQAEAGMLVVSGGAEGIDAAAHLGALRGGGPTLAYVGGPVDRVYPAAHHGLFEAMVARGGAVVSEHPPGAANHAWHHAARNRFIAAHGSSLVVVEAAAKSGTLGTVAHARRLGADIWVSPADVARQREGLDLLLRKQWARVYGGPHTRKGALPIIPGDTSTPGLAKGGLLRA